MRRQLRELQNPLYLNANLIYGEALKFFQKKSWKRTIKTTVLSPLKKKYSLVTSILTRMEIIQRLRREESISGDRARKIYFVILEKYGILEIINIRPYVILTPKLCEKIALSNVDFKDALHLEIAKNLRISLCTHDKKMLRGFSLHSEKKKIYKKIFKPSDLLK